MCIFHHFPKKSQKNRKKQKKKNIFKKALDNEGGFCYNSDVAKLQMLL
jgi:hypothetical protein